jgi:hypothetical protein
MFQTSTKALVKLLRQILHAGKWWDSIAALPLVQQGLKIPEPNVLLEAYEDPDARRRMIEDAQSLLRGEGGPTELARRRAEH